MSSMSLTIEPEAVNHAYCLDAPCPAWCAARHEDRDFYDDRAHYGEALDVPLSTVKPIQGYTEDARTADFLRVHVERRYREAAPRIWVDRNEDRTEYVLTLAESEELAQALTALVAQARQDS